MKCSFLQESPLHGANARLAFLFRVSYILWPNDSPVRTLDRQVRIEEASFLRTHSKQFAAPIANGIVNQASCGRKGTANHVSYAGGMAPRRWPSLCSASYRPRAPRWRCMCSGQNLDMADEQCGTIMTRSSLGKVTRHKMQGDSSYCIFVP